MKKMLALLALICLVIQLYSCKKDPKANTENHSNTFVTGYWIDRKSSPYPLACYWAEGRQVILASEFSSARAIALKGEDVYVAGKYDDKPVYWKNAAMYYLPTNVKDGSSIALSISIDGEDVYIFGSDGGATIWKNGLLYKQIKSNLTYSGFKVYHGDIYYYNSSAYIDGAHRVKYWKNEDSFTIYDKNIKIEDMAVRDTNIYLCGTNDSTNSVYLWKNGLRTDIRKNSSTDALYDFPDDCLSIDGTDVYVFFYESDMNAKTSKLRYWKNGSIYDFPLPNGFFANRIKVIDGHMYYTGGIINSSGPSQYGAAYGIDQDLHFLNKDEYSGTEDIAIRQ